MNEALAAGFPVLDSLYSQNEEKLVQDDITGWTFRPDRPEETYAALDRTMTVPDEQLDEMRRAARARIRVLSPEYGAKCYIAAIDFARSSPGQGSLPNIARPVDQEPITKAEV